VLLIFSFYITETGFVFAGVRVDVLRRVLQKNMTQSCRAGR